MSEPPPAYGSIHPDPPGATGAAPYPPAATAAPPYSPQQPYPPQGNTGYPPSEPAYPQKSQYPPVNNQPPPSVNVQVGTQPQPIVMAQPAQTTVVVTNTPYRSQVYRTFPVEMNCPYCNEHITTQIDYKTGGMTWLLAGAICLVGCICGCCLIPFFTDGCKNAVHSCPKCHRVISEYHRL